MSADAPSPRPNPADAAPRSVPPVRRSPRDASQRDVPPPPTFQEIQRSILHGNSVSAQTFRRRHLGN